MMKRNVVLLFLLFISLNLIAEENSNINISFSISSPPIPFADKYYEDEGNTGTSATLGFSYLNVSGDIFSLNNISIDLSGNHLKSKMGILYSNLSVYGGLGEIKNVLDDSKMPLYYLGTLAGFNFQTKYFIVRL